LLAQMGFWQGFFLLLIFIPLAFIWAFALLDIFRRDMSGWVKAIWIIAIIIFPVFGALIYLIARPVTKDDVAMQQAYLEQRDFAQAARATDQLHKLSILRDKGDITQEEFEKKKAKLLG
jgi:uncharacterized membrane protein